MMQCWISLAILSFIVVLSLGQDYPELEITLGKIRGRYKLSYNNRTFSAYEGIPYAKPPIGNLRFEEPVQLLDPWSEILDANTLHTCIQLRMEPFGSEDCLYLNVYVPEDKSVPKTNLDVILFIHGGAFVAGDTEMGGPEYLMDRNIVYVTMSYRLGAFGFLSTEDNIVPGNNGLKDQIMALRWIQKYIAQFGGNPNSVTVTGLSAGSGSVHFLYFSPLAKGLFHHGVSQGGSALAPWAIHKAPLAKAKQLAASVGCDNSSTEELVKCLKQAPAEQIVIHTPDSPFPGFPLTPFAPVIEKQSTGAFLTDYPYKLLKSGNINNVPWIIGSTTEEGILGIISLGLQYDTLNANWDTALPYVLSYENTVEESDKVEVARKIKEFYLDNENVTEDNIQSFISLFSHRHFHLDLERSARLHAKIPNSRVYAYLYGYKGDINFDALVGLKKYYGACHGNDAHFLYDMKLFGVKLRNGTLSENDEKIKDLLVDFVTSFAKTGKPISDGVIWNPVSDSSDLSYLFIHNDEIKMRSVNEIAPLSFWETLPLKEYDNFVSRKN